MFKYLIILLLLCSSSIFAYPDKRKEVYFSFRAGSRVVLNQLTNFIAIDKRLPDGTVFAYARDDIFKSLSSYSLIASPNYSNVLQLKHDSLARGEVVVGTYDSVESFTLDVYPTYDSYIKLMYDFARKYPAICKIVVIGKSVRGRELLALKISDNVNKDESEPEVLLDSNIHGNELTGYPLLLKLAHELLTNYGKDEQIRRLVDNTELWVMPLRNPDGTYAKGNGSIKGATRFNAHYIDLNRNFPDTKRRISVFSLSFEPETRAIVDFVNKRNFVMGATIHAGAEVLNYPWDSMEAKHPDNAWFISVTRNYVDLIHTMDSNYMNDLDDGITNGYAWYSIMGGFQDYMNYYKQTRIITFELSNKKIPRARALKNYWDKNKASMFEFILRAQESIHGVVVDSVTGLPVSAEVYVVNDEGTGLPVYASFLGDFHKVAMPGEYTVKVKASGYVPVEIENVIVGDRGSDLFIKLKAL